MRGQEFILSSVILMFGGHSCIHAFLSPSRNFHLQLTPTRHLSREFNLTPAKLSESDDENTVSMTEESDNFDAAGFGNYLAPYLLAFVISIAITGGFVKFVLMDY